MKNFLNIFFMAAAILLSGCGGNTEAAQAPIELDNGKKWSVDAAMLEHIAAMETEVNSFNAEEGDIKELQNTLQDNIKQLTSKCTMQGQAHDELHKWLMPLMETVKNMKGPESIDRLREHFNTFHTYFE